MSSQNGSLRDKIANFGTKVWAIILVVSVLVFLLNFIVAQFNTARENNARSLSAELQVLSQKLAKYSKESVEGQSESFDQLAATKTRISTIVKALNEGSASENVAGYKGSLNAVGVSSALSKVTEIWTGMSKDADLISSSKKQIVDFSANADNFTTRIPQISVRLDEVVRTMSDSGAASSQVTIANRQVVLADRMSRRVTEIRAGGDAAKSASDALERDSTTFSRVLKGLKQGNLELGVSQVTSPSALNAVNAVDKLYVDSQKDLTAILDAADGLSEVQQSATKLSGDADVMEETSKALSDSFDNISLTSVFPNNYWAIGSGILALFSLIGLVTTASKGQRVQLSETKQINQRNQEAILRLLDEIGSLGEGDLTVNATVTEDITGAIADSINFAVDQLRSLVSTINETAVQVAAAAQETQATAMHLAEAAEHQAQQITSASQQINSIASSIDQVSKNSAESADVASRSVQIAAKGADVVRQTIQGMDNIRDQIQETSKRIKRLGESSQEIGSIVELINDISEQTNILALNAAIQAASAGEAGRGFAVVADEVQRLAERASNATKRIEALVQTIQSDTNEAVSSMEQTTAEVVSGARLAEDAGLALGEIEKVSNDLADLIQSISTAARQQSTAATNITATMSVIQEITTQTSQGASQTADSIGNLAQLAADLRRSVADFKLPG
jgi:twitching motility protein PilJ